ncbi:SPOR domain-containing protein [Alphaproteobacteria bacterium KMM 3653]|uniref:SPOR domain-containing protein n=1 Tax=Harenicola maris TaxID=2841044 RepID=A0AAP2CRR1_9RHOB|nr:SPOR domain-containing protein [Harenicola maris]
MGKAKILHSISAIALVVALAGCDDAGQFSFDGLKKQGDAGGDVTASAQRPAASRLVEQDVEAPDVFQATDSGLWDGRPSLGGVWVAYPGVAEPERVIIRNEANGKFVIGALFKRERENPGPKVQVSSDAAAALGMLAGSPAELNITALRRSEAPAAPELAPEGEDIAAAIDAPEAIEAAPLNAEPDALAAAAAALDKIEDPVKRSQREIADSVISPANVPQAIQTSAAAPLAPAAPAPAATPVSTGKNFIQIGIFSVETNAQNTATSMRSAGMIPTVLKQESRGKTFWRVTVGPATSASDRAVLLKKVKGLGFSDAYFVTN